MERTTFNLLFYIRRTKLNKTGEAPVFMRLTIDGSRAEASVKHTIKPNNWSTAKGRAANTSKEGKSLNVCLDAITTNIMRIRRELEFEGVELTAHTVMDRYLGRDKPERHTLLEIFNEHNEKYRRLSGIDIAPGTVQRHLTCYRLTEEFIKRTYKLLGNEILDIFRAELDKMPARTREIFLASRVEHLTYAEIAERFDISVRKVTSEIQSALQILRHALKDYLPLCLLFLFGK